MAIQHNVLRNTFWLFAERMGVQILQFALAIILARLLNASEFGLLALSGVFTSILSLLTSGGFELALIQKKEITEEDCASVFYINLLMSIFAYFAIYFSAPGIELFFNVGSITAILRVLSITLFFNSLIIVPKALLARRLQFYKTFWISLISVLCSMTISLLMVWKQCGVWALVAQQVSYSFVLMIAYYIAMRWWPQRRFSFQNWWSMFRFSGKIMLTYLLNSLYGNFFTLLVGKLYSPLALGYYWRGERMAQFAIYGFNSCCSVLLPVFSERQDKPDEIKLLLRRAIRLAAFLLAPMSTLIVITASPIIIILLTDKWLPSVIFFQLLMIQYFFFPLQAMCQQAYLARGDSRHFLIVEILKKILGIIVIFATMKISLKMMAIGQVVVAALGLLICCYPNFKRINYSLLNLVVDVFPSITISIIGGFIAYYLGNIFSPIYMKIFFSCIVFCTFYLGFSIILKLDSFSYCLKILSKFPIIRRLRQYLFFG